MSKKNDDVMPKEIFRSDGTLRYLTLATNYPLCGGTSHRLIVQVNQTKFNENIWSLKIEDNILDAYKEVVDWLAAFHGISKRSKTYQAMLDSITEFKKRYDIGVALVTVIKQVIIPGEKYNGKYTPRPRFLKRFKGHYVTT